MSAGGATRSCRSCSTTTPSRPTISAAVPCPCRSAPRGYELFQKKLDGAVKVVLTP